MTRWRPGWASGRLSRQEIFATPRYGRDPRGIRVNALAPGFFPTELTRQLSSPALRKPIAQRALLGRVPTLTEIDGPLLFLASDAASYVTGHVLTVDGGWTAA